MTWERRVCVKIAGAAEPMTSLEKWDLLLTAHQGSSSNRSGINQSRDYSGAASHI